MFVRNCLTAGTYFEVVPVGIDVTLHYDADGRIEKITKGFVIDGDDITDAMLPLCLTNKMIPATILIKNGTTYIPGVFYTSMTASSSGELSECVQDELLHMMQEYPENFHFYAGAVRSLASVIHGASNIRKWLTGAGFDILPAYILPSTVNTDSEFMDMISSNSFEFKLPLISAFITFQTEGYTFVRTGIYQKVVKRVTRGITDSGLIVAKVTFMDDIYSEINYSDVTFFQVNKNTLLVFSKEGDILYSECIDDKIREPRPKKIECSVCGAPITVPDEGVCRCPNEHCKSNMYIRAVKLLGGLALPHPDKAHFDSAFKNVVEVTGSDILREFGGAGSAVVSISDAIRAAIPVTVLPGANSISSLVNRCNNSKSTVIYFMSHPDKLLSELNLDKAVYTKLVNWLDDPINQEDVINILSSDIISVTTENKKFDGPPIFRSNTFVLTGEFRHGSIDEVTSILSSYSATVITALQGNVSAVIVGDTFENINGQLIQEARSKKIPVLTESQFFDRYDIDSDLVENL